ncbi:XRE family transcriptional regulator [Gemmobacter fulvus]|uniref:XRE family transcriptional regulator n=1 Tax=Gemmobacter fulvus TaxID=2840474 RepID=A0A975S140_9RHOB|nr:XRE family transcriptional regulator [Gemmobacter fulvus]MBT9245446.1 XRE family transcriptional regulator [Gemmobacter fulvus]QWK90247.1 XRE family transcriptional regulator [Gemmobacter fulvus]
MASELGETIRQTRKRLKLTLRDLSERSGLTVSQLSKLENGKQRISVDLALKIAGVLQVPVTSFLAAPRPMPQARRSITRAGEGTRHETQGLVFEVLCSDFRDKSSLFWNVTVTGRSLDETGGWRSHSGEEFVQVLSGTLELHTRHYEPLVLNTGDSLLFDGEMEHGYVCLGAGPARLFMSNSMQRTMLYPLPDAQG